MESALTNEINTILPVPPAMPNYPISRLRPRSVETVKAHLDSGVTKRSVCFLDHIRDAAEDESERSQARNKELSLFESRGDIAEQIAKLKRISPVKTPVNQVEESRDDSQESVIVKPLNPRDSVFTAQTKESLCQSPSSSGRSLVLVPADSLISSETSEAEDTSRTVSGQHAEESSVVSEKLEYGTRLYRLFIVDEMSSSEYEKVIRIVVDKSDQTTTLIVHQHLVDALTAVLGLYGTTTAEGVLLTSNDYCLGIEPQTWHYFIHWVYTNEFISRAKGMLTFPELLDLYFLAVEFSIVVLRNVVIDHLIDECSHSLVPSGMSRKIYKNTRPKDPLRQLWVDFYLWDMPEDRFQVELKSNDLSPRFIKDLAAAQMKLLRTQEAIYDRPPPYEKDRAAYHRRDHITGTCCCRAQFEGNRHLHRCDYMKEKTGLENKLIEAKRSIRELEDQVLDQPKPSKKRKLVHGLRGGEAQA